MSRFITLAICLSIPILTARAQNSNTPLDFGQIRSMVDSNRFEILFTVATTHYNYYLQPATPYSDENIRIDRDSAFMVVNDTIATGYLPYFSSGYSFPQTGLKGIIFDNKMITPSVKMKGKRNKQAINYQFDVIGKNDAYKIRLDIQYDGTCYLYVTSTRRSPISYIGKISPLTLKI